MRSSLLVALSMWTAALQVSCAPPGSGGADSDADDVEDHESALSSCVNDVGHWTFWGACSEDVPLGPGAPVHAASAGEVVKVYASCGGFAGRSIRVQDGSGVRTMYGHMSPAISVGDWLDAGSFVGTTFAGSGPVYCDASLTSCGIGRTASRPTLCWSGPHLHREGPCCGAAAPSGLLVRNEHSGRCAEIASYSRANGGRAVQWGCHGDANQRWELVDVGDGFFELRNAHSGKCLEVHGWSTEDAASVVQWGCHGGANQRWQAVDVGDGLHELRNEHSGKCLEVDAWATGDAARLSQWTCLGQANQRWRLEE